jgi:MoxR-like ATPase
MFKGDWIDKKEYLKGDIVYAPIKKSYFICIKNHYSDKLVYPSKDDLYWLLLDNKFINILSTESNTNSNYTLLDTNNITSTINRKDKIKNNKDNNDDNINNNDTNTIKIKTKFNRPKRPNGIITHPFEILNKQEQDELERQKQIDKKDIDRQNLKRKLDDIETELENYKKQKNDNDLSSLRNQLLLLNLDVATKSFLVDKYDTAKNLSNSDYSKAMSWFKTVVSLPFGKYKNKYVEENANNNKNNNNNTNKTENNNIQMFFKNVKSKLDKYIYGLEDVKQEILEFIARKISNPDSKGHVLALAGPPGTGKSKIIKSLAEALELPFFQINCGGLNDVSVLIGHSETYIGSKPGKIVEILQNSQYMNPIIYLDELDKISENKSVEINGVLTHLLDEEQNNKFQDVYLSNISIDLSKVFFVISFNDVSKIDEIVLDRLKVIYIDKPSIQDKIKICKEKIIPELIKSVNFTNKVIDMSEEVIEYIIYKCKEDGVRQLRKSIEKILNRLNYDILIDNKKELIINIDPDTKNNIYKITQTYIDKILKTKNEEEKPYMSMYI